MAAWSDGYVTDIQYTGKFFGELAPGYLAFACLRQGVRPPALGRGSSYLELGCGQGFGLNLLAAANPWMSFMGVDFHPGQIANARRLADEAGLSNVGFEDFSFEQMLRLPEGRLERYDVVALHGVYSWVSEENRRVLVELLDRVLKPGGLAYVSYNCLPGWATQAPLQRFVAEHVARGGGDVQVRVVEALRAALALADGGAVLVQETPSLRRRIEEALSQDPVYLAHEYLNDHSRPFYHADVARQLEGARLSFAASANAADDLINLAAPAALQPIIQQAADPTWRETLLDYASAKPFRRDIFVRGRNTLSGAERQLLLDATRFALLVAPGAEPFEIAVPIGQLTGQPGVYRPILEALLEAPRSLAELRALPALAGAREGAVLQAVTLLVGGRRIHPVATEPGQSASAVLFNRAVIARSEFGETPAFLASTVAGTGVRLEFSDLMAARASIDGILDPAEAARRGWEIMERTGRRLLREGQLLPDQAENEAELARRITQFNAAWLGQLRGLGVI